MPVNCQRSSSRARDSYSSRGRQDLRDNEHELLPAFLAIRMGWQRRLWASTAGRTTSHAHSLLQLSRCRLCHAGPGGRFVRTALGRWFAEGMALGRHRCPGVRPLQFIDDANRYLERRARGIGRVDAVEPSCARRGEQDHLPRRWWDPESGRPQSLRRQPTRGRRIRFAGRWCARVDDRLRRHGGRRSRRAGWVDVLLGVGVQCLYRSGHTGRHLSTRRGERPERAEGITRRRDSCTASRPIPADWDDFWA